MEAFTEFLTATFAEMWEICEALGFWLLVGFVLAGIVGQLLPLRFIRRHLSGQGVGSVFKAVLLGIPLPLCSCGVIPVSASLRKAGASRGAVAAFTAATPQTGIESIAACWSLMGLPFTIGRVVADVVAGFFAGCFINVLEKRGKPVDHIDELHACDQCQTEETKSPVRSWKVKLKAALREGLIDLPAEIGPYVIAGIVLGAVLTALFPHEALGAYLGNRWIAYTAVTLLALPLYVCATGSIPIAYALVAMGFSPGAAIIFLVLGPATNPSTIAVLWKILGKGATFIYLLALGVAAWVTAFIFDSFAFHLGGELADEHAHEHIHGGAFFAVLMLVVFAIAFYVRRREGGRCRTHAGHHHDQL